MNNRKENILLRSALIAGAIICGVLLLDAFLPVACGQTIESDTTIYHNVFQEHAGRIPLDPQYIDGDVDLSGTVDVDDIMVLISYVFGGVLPAVYDSVDLYIECVDSVWIEDGELVDVKRYMTEGQTAMLKERE